MPSGTHVRLPLLLTDDVQFPCTRVRLPLAGALLCDLLVRPPDERWLGVVLAPQPGAATGTASRLLELEPDGDGARCVLLGAHRFALAEPPAEAERAPPRPRFVPDGPRPAAPRAAARRARAAAAHAARGDRGRLEEAIDVLGEAMPLRSRHAAAASSSAPFEELVNRLAAELDVPPLRKLQLLVEPLPERAARGRSRILRSRHQVVDLLRPYRHLAGAAESN